MARHPNQVSPYGPIRPNSLSFKGGKSPEYMVRKDTQERDLKALEMIQAQRPAKPPGRR